MTAALIKRDSPMARDAVLPATRPQAAPAPSPTAEERLIAQLRGEVEALRGELATLRARWDGDLAAAEQRATAAAARDHVRDDAAQREQLARALAEARRTFEDGLQRTADEIACDLAVTAMRKLFATRAEDESLLANVVVRRLAEIDAASVVELAVSPGDAERARLDEVVAGGARIVVDPSIRRGTARVRLRLGAMVIDPAEGFARLCAALSEGAGDA